ncbi:hypothetical protein C488_02106 [Natrinema pellirubrum DSM 15624]|nr:hypothetical protein C488_02106 [Natrinema pellirubrum DSM 15624]
MTLALIGSMAFVGFAGTAAAGGNQHDDGDSSADRLSASSVSQSQSVSQTNVIEQNASQYADQDATGVDIDEFLTGDDGAADDDDEASDGNNSDGNNSDGATTTIETLTFYRAAGNSPGDVLVGTERWLGSGFSNDNVDVNVEESVDGDPVKVSWDYTGTGTSDNKIVRIEVGTSSGDLCEVTYDSPQESGEIGPDQCESLGDTPDETPDETPDDGNSVEGSVGNQTVNQIVEQNADASNSNAQNADASASAGDILSVLLG